MSETSSWIIDTTDNTFEVDVMTRSELGLVLVDFWADWCAPCRMLGPILEKLAVELDGKFTLVKAETEQNQQAAAAFGVSGIPAVFAVLDGQVLDRFEGAMPEPAIRSWLESLDSSAKMFQAIRLADQDPAAAEEALRGILSASPDHAGASVALARLYLAQQRTEECRKLLEELESRGFLEPEAEKLRAMLTLKEKSHIDVEAAQTAATANPDDFPSQLELAEALIGQEEYARAMEICLTLVERDRPNTGEQARALMVDVFKSLPADSEIVSEYRRKLSMLLF